ncbi:biotin/lipoyl-containing protein [Fictibacillus gelatini]|uniref:biotin/lipoyl-containing protein n=1 Tax=Fictibacillus gelatini TaxID=225985 RepID=UPI00041F1E60|nr:biotin/lipoyl-containing protein [Fictibacillus gelatini]
MKEINANMAGTVLNVLVNKGEGVSPGQLVVVLESMKMEIPIESTVEGTVTDIKVGIGDFVNEGDTLVILT